MAAWLASGASGLGAPTSGGTHAISRFEVAGAAVLAPAEIDRILAPATGPAVSLEQIRAALLELQQACRRAGMERAVVSLPRQTAPGGVVRLTVSEAAPGAPTPSGTPTAVAIRHFEVRGNTALSAQELDTLLSPVAGDAVTPAQLRDTLARVQETYRTRGFAAAQVRIPAQSLTDGVLRVEVVEGTVTPPTVAAAAPAPGDPPSPPAAPAGPRFAVDRYEVSGNTLLRPETVEAAFADATGPEIGLADIQRGVGALQLAYRDRGFATVTVGLPRQQITNGVVKVEVIEGVLAEIRVTGNRHFSSNNVVRALPSLRTNEVLNSRVFQRELDLANQNRDRQIFPTIGPGPEPGTSSLNLRVKDRLPLHGRLELNNHATPNTPEWRVNASVQYNNLWQLEHAVGLSYGFSPEEFKAPGLVDDVFFNRPLISNFGGYYRLPLSPAESVAEALATDGSFGYDEATRQFRLPPPGTRPDLTLFANTAESDTGVQLGPANVVSQTPLLTIVSQDSARNLSINDVAGARLAVPRTLANGARLGLSAGVDWKRYYLESYNTNNFIITTVVTNAQGSQTIETRVASPQPVRRNDIGYLPVTLALDYVQGVSNRTYVANLSLSANVLGDADGFRALAYSRDTRDEYARATLALSHDRPIYRDWTLNARASGQLATGPLVSNEQFALGGLGSVRGYYEGEDYGDAGWFGSLEIRSPFIATRVPVWTDYAPVWLRGIAFADVGQRFLYDAADSIPWERVLAGSGFGVTANLNNHVDLRIIVGWPLIDSPTTPAGSPRAYFSLGGQF